MNNYYIKTCDNFFPIFIRRQILADYMNQGTNFVYVPNITYDIKNLEIKEHIDNWKKNNNIGNTEGFTHTINEDSLNYKSLEKNLKTFIEKKFDIKVKKFIRIMISYLPPNPNFDENSILGPHVDHININHFNLLYYLFDNDADTLFFDKIHDPTIKLQDQDYPKLNIYKRIQVKENRAVLFNGLIYHSGNVSKYSKRVTLNVNFLQE